MALRDEIVRYVETSLLRGEAKITAEESLIDRGLIDSIGLMQLMAFLEERTGVRIPDTHVTPERFLCRGYRSRRDSIRGAACTARVAKKLKGTAIYERTDVIVRNGKAIPGERPGFK